MLQQLLSFDWTWVLTAVLGLLTYLVVSQWIRTRTLPPGPTPLPIIGNLWTLAGKTRTDETIAQYRAKYGDVFTIWVGMDPMVVVCGWDRIKEGLVTKKNAFSGRNSRFSFDLVIDGGHMNVIQCDYNPTFEALRKMFALAVRRYSTGEKLPTLADDVIRQVVTLMHAEQEPFDPTNYIYLTIYNIMASTAFGKRYDLDDEEFLNLKKVNDEAQVEIGFGTILDIYPWLVYFLKGKTQRSKDILARFMGYIEKQYKQHKETYNSADIRDFTDACIAAKEEAELEDNTTGAFTDGNMVRVMFDFFSAGTDTTRITLMWILLYLTQYPEIQDRVRSEIRDAIGDRAAVQDDRHKCPYTRAVLTETLRLRPVISFSLEHKTTCDTDFAGYKIPKDTSAVFHIRSQHVDSKYWKDPEEFKPERFLEEDGTFMTISRFTGYLPFSLGRRACPGEKLALADLFLVLVGLLQKCRFKLPGGPGTADLEPQNLLVVNIPKPYKLIAEKI